AGGEERRGAAVLGDGRELVRGPDRDADRGGVLVLVAEVGGVASAAGVGHAFEDRLDGLLRGGGRIGSGEARTAVRGLVLRHLLSGQGRRHRPHRGGGKRPGQQEGRQP